jgi:hypothetical protein
MPFSPAAPTIGKVSASFIMKFMPFSPAAPSHYRQGQFQLHHQIHAIVEWLL